MAPLLHVCSAPVVYVGGSLKSKRSECDVVHCTDSRVPIANERGRFQTHRLFSYCVSVIGYQLATVPATAPECGRVINLHVNVQRQKYSQSALD